ncbi:Mucin-associated surface protein (MASP) [Trypanosoma cruzi]|uniref:Mucin-associated surface protein (MASP) n=1 Tax=Trypanosoma cruzi TaxID=5693 RepID=A0A7J6XUB0_TRYCR|nr:Mucin-associated surface protein (MASP) [Trypanosoma cruzi]
MAMMMITERVLLVCALCVPWCGLCGVAADDVYVPPGDSGTSGKNGVGVGVQPPVLSDSPGANEDPTDKDTEESESGSLESDDLDGQSLPTEAVKDGVVADVSEDGLPRQEEGTIVPPGQPEPVPRVELPSEVKATRPLAPNPQEQPPNTPTEDDPLSTGPGGNRPTGELAETASLSPPKDGGAASGQTAGGTTDKSPHNDPLPGAAVTVQNHREGSTELSEKEAKSTRATASTTDPGSTQNSSINPAAGPSVPQEEAATRDASPTPKPASSAAGAEGSAGTSSPLETPGSAGGNSPAGIAGTGGTTDSSSSAASRAPDLGPSGELPGAAHSASAASSAPESPPDTRPTGGGSHSSHDSPVELQEETSAAPLTQLSQTGEDGSAAEGTEEDAATSTDDTATSEGNTTAASMPAPLSSAPTTKALENRVGNDACFHDTRPHARLLLVLAALMYGTLG